MQRIPPSTLHALLLASIFSACSLLEPTSPEGSGADGIPVDDAQLHLAPTADTINAVGDTLRLQANVVVGDQVRSPQSGVVWQTLNPSVASVNVLGEVVARGVGVALITAACECAATADTATVHVRQVLASVTVKPEGSTLLPQRSEQLTATPADSNGVPIGGLTLTWQSSNPAVAIVNNGQVTAEAAGAALITAYIGDRVGWSAVTVSPRSVAAIVVEPSQATIAFGDTLRFGATAYDSTGAVMEGASFAWGSSDTAVATVLTGLVKGRAAGTTVITASAGGKTGSGTVTVLPPPVYTISVSPAQSTLEVGGAARLTAVAYDPNGNVIEGTSFTWNSSAPAIARVTDGLVEALASGSTTITASTSGVNGTASVTVQAPSPPPPSGVLAAFPGAEGWGALALSGCDRNNLQLLRVTNLNDSGVGSLRDALARVQTNAFSVIVFDVAGIITLSSRIEINNGCLYVAGQTAPGGGITLRAPDSKVFFTKQDAHDLVIRYIRIRPGTNRPGENTNSVGLVIGTGPRVMIDHVSFSWANDELLSIYKYHWDYSKDVTDITVQRTLLSEPLKSSPVCYTTDGTLADGLNANGIPEWYEVERITLHHNATIHCHHRNPGIGSKDAQVINNVVYQWELAAVYTGTGKPWVDYIGNYFKRGPMNVSSALTYGREFSHRFIVNKPGGVTGTESDNYVLISRAHLTADGRAGPQFYLSGNVGPSNPDGALDNWIMTSKYKTDGTFYPDSIYETVTYSSAGLMPTAIDGIPLRRSTPLPQAAVPVRIEAANAAWNSIILDGDVGANRRLDCAGNWVSNVDDVDRRVLRDAREGTGPTTSTIPASENDVGGYPRIDPATACGDADRDGMPNDYETRCGFDANNAADAVRDRNGDGYINLEDYLSGRCPS